MVSYLPPISGYLNRFFNNRLDKSIRRISSCITNGDKVDYTAHLFVFLNYRYSFLQDKKLIYSVLDIPIPSSETIVQVSDTPSDIEYDISLDDRGAVDINQQIETPHQYRPRFINILDRSTPCRSMYDLKLSDEYSYIWILTGTSRDNYYLHLSYITCDNLLSGYSYGVNNYCSKTPDTVNNRIINYFKDYSYQVPSSILVS